MGSAFTLGKRKPIVGNGEELRKITYYSHSTVFLFSDFFSSYFHTCREIHHTQLFSLLLHLPSQKISFSNTNCFFSHQVNTETGR